MTPSQETLLQASYHHGTSPLKTYLFGYPIVLLTYLARRIDLLFLSGSAWQTTLIEDPILANVMHAQNYRFYISIAGLALLQQGSSFDFYRLPS